MVCVFLFFCGFFFGCFLPVEFWGSGSLLSLCDLSLPFRPQWQRFTDLKSWTSVGTPPECRRPRYPRQEARPQVWQMQPPSLWPLLGDAGARPAMGDALWWTEVSLCPTFISSGGFCVSDASGLRVLWSSVYGGRHSHILSFCSGALSGWSSYFPSTLQSEWTESLPDHPGMVPCM